jgi:hypothetical protein
MPFLLQEYTGKEEKDMIPKTKSSDTVSPFKMSRASTEQTPLDMTNDNIPTLINTNME